MTCAKNQKVNNINFKAFHALNLLTFFVMTGLKWTSEFVIGDVLGIFPLGAEFSPAAGWAEGRGLRVDG